MILPSTFHVATIPEPLAELLSMTGLSHLLECPMCPLRLGRAVNLENFEAFVAKYGYRLLHTRAGVKLERIPASRSL